MGILDLFIFKGGKVEAKDLQKVLGSMGIELTSRELWELLKLLPITSDGKVEKNVFLDCIKSFPGGKYNVSKMENILENIGYELEDEEIEDLRNHLSDDDGRKVKMNALMKNLKPFTGNKVSANEVRGVLENMGIELTLKECWELLKTLPITSDGKVYQNRLIDSLKNFRGGKAFENKLETVLENLNFDLEKEEMKDLRRRLKIDDTGNIPLNSLMNKTSIFSGGKINANDIQLHLRNLGIELTNKESKELQDLLPFDDNKRVYKNRLMEGVKTYRGGKINLDKINDAVENMGLPLEE
ncbi:uncharacterized protein LOC119514796 [Choloepus didactylus]|uniref:uncharacterized protein LOC119514796 n=1 Tax=Choloepus didactylus TaxID=27675 RepID=UPI00189C9D11|nr:uncharacterized protein LOC119514796 [Choloepus didactylus]